MWGLPSFARYRELHSFFSQVLRGRGAGVSTRENWRGGGGQWLRTPASCPRGCWATLGDAQSLTGGSVFTSTYLPSSDTFFSRPYTESHTRYCHPQQRRPSRLPSVPADTGRLFSGKCEPDRFFRGPSCQAFKQAFHLSTYIFISE